MQESTHIELKRVFKDLDLVEHMGSGVPRVLECYPPSVYHFSQSFIRVTLPFAEGFKQDTGQDTGQDLNQEDAVLEFCQTPRSTKEIMQHLGLKHRESFRDTILLPLIAEGKLALTIPDIPKSPKQKYVTVDSKYN